MEEKKYWVKTRKRITHQGKRSSSSLPSVPSTTYAQYFTKHYGHPEEWHRGNLPHRDKPNIVQFITFRQADSLPKEVLATIEQNLKNLPEEKYKIEKRKLGERYLNKGLGSCALGHPEMAQTMMKALLHHDGGKYDLLAWSIMPNHVHVLIKTEDKLPKIVQSWKSFTGKWALNNNEKYKLGIAPKAVKFWMPEYWDRFIRDEKHFNNTIKYIMNNPKSARLAEESTAAMYTGTKINDGM